MTHASIRSRSLSLSLALGGAALAACAGKASPVTVACPGDPAAAAAAPRPPTMTVSGTATLEMVPDTADMHITLSAEHARPRLAAQAVRVKQATLAKALADAGIAPVDVSLSALTINPVYDDKGRLLDYAAAITVTASTHDFDRLAEVMEAAATSGATSTSTTFRVADLASLKKKVRAQALAAVKEKAQQTTEGLGAKLGAVRDISESQGGEGWGWNGVANSVEIQPRAQVGTGARADAQTLTLTITATYELG